MNWLDIIIIVLLVFGAFGGWRTGLVKSLLSLAGLIVGITLAGRYYLTLCERLAFIPQDKVAQIVAFAIILVGVMIIAGIVALLLNWILSSLMLGWVNRIGGAVFGFLMSVLFISTLLAIWVKFLGISSVVSESSLASLLLKQFPTVLALLPPEFDVIRSFFR